MALKNRGRYLEEWINESNAIYEKEGRAIITKIPTPWQVQRKYSPYKKTYEIAFAFPQAKSTVDFGGTAGKRSIWFDAKATTQKYNFPLKNIHKHQIEYLKKVQEQGGRAFFLIHSEELRRTWLLWINDLLGFMDTNTRKSIPFTWFDEHCAIIHSNGAIILDYLSEVFKQREG